MYYKKWEKQYFYVDRTGWTHRRIASKQHTLEFDRVSCSSFSTEGGMFMTQQDEWQAHPINASRQGRQHAPNMEADNSSTYVKPAHEGSAQSFYPYTYAPETAIPPPPPDIDLPLVIPSKSFSGYRIALAVLSVLVVVLGSLELLQVVTHTLLATDPSVSASSNQAGITPTQHADLHVRTLTPGTIKENVMLICSGCNNPVLTTITAVTVDTTNLRTVWTMKLENVSGAQQIDYFAEFSLHDPYGNTFEGTGNINMDYFLDAGQTATKTEIFSFLPNPSTTYTLFTRLGISGTSYDPLQLTF
jgi:hypothetical protein